MTIKNLTNEIFEKSFSRESLERLLTREIKHKLEYALLKCNKEVISEIISETLKSE